MDEILRVLRPGGLALFETPNARNLLVTAGDFYRDPTHKRPLFPDTLEALAEFRGFSNSTVYCFNENRTEIQRLSEVQFNDLADYVTVSRDAVWMGTKSRMRIAIATVQVPFISGGAEALALGLSAGCKLAGHEVEIVTMPSRFSPESEVAG